MSGNLTGIARAIDIAQGLTSLATALGEEKQTVNQWRSRGVPPRHCPVVERITGVPCEELRPDIAWRRVPDPAWPRGKPLVDVAPTPHRAEPAATVSEANA